MEDEYDNGARKEAPVKAPAGVCTDEDIQVQVPAGVCADEDIQASVAGSSRKPVPATVPVKPGARMSGMVPVTTATRARASVAAPTDSK